MTTNMIKLSTTDYSVSEGQSYSEWSWGALTPECRAWIEDASDDWLYSTIGIYRDRDGDLDMVEGIILTALEYRAETK